MSFVKIWIHTVWGTKNREPILSNPQRETLFLHIKENAKYKSIYIDSIGGYYDHVHCLLSLKNNASISEILQLIKGEASFWANKQALFSQKLEWASEYFAVSVSESMVDNVRSYIKNQETHHQKKSFAQEYEEFIKKYEFIINNG
jgi:REP element-mobilizing transposase RayT